jgi:hypothetical protein
MMAEETHRTQPGMLEQFRADFSASAAVQGMVVAIVGYMSSVAILI